MTEARHTEGVMNTSGRYVLSKKGETIAACQNSDDAREIAHRWNCWEEAIEALKNMIDIAKFDDWPKALTGRQIILKDAEAALRKATGEESPQ